MYRTVALAFLRHATAYTEAAAKDLLASVHLEITFDGTRMGMRLDGHDITPLLRAPEISAMASRVATMKSVRQYLLPLQHGLATRYGLDSGLVAEGRDMGTVVFPEADLKFFLTASMDVRAQRRLFDLHKQGENVVYEEVLSAIIARDEQDSKRSLAPLRQAADAILINTDLLSLDEQVDLVLNYIWERVRQTRR